jgi:hypothetical protein
MNNKFKNILYHLLLTLVFVAIPTFVMENFNFFDIFFNLFLFSLPIFIVYSTLYIWRIRRPFEVLLKFFAVLLGPTYLASTLYPGGLHTWGFTAVYFGFALNVFIWLANENLHLRIALSKKGIKR